MTGFNPPTLDSFQATVVVVLDGGLTMDVGDWWCVEGQCGGDDGDLTKNFEVVVVMIVTGVEGESDADSIDRVLQKRRLKDKYFKSIDRITYADLKKAFLQASTPRVDRHKLSLTLIIEGVFNAPDNHADIEISTLSIVDDQDIFFSYPWGKVSYRRLIGGFRASLGRKFVDAKNKKEKTVTYTGHGFPIAMQLHIHATLHPTKAERGQPYISTIVLFEDCNVPALDDVPRDSITPQFHAEPLGSGDNVENSIGASEEEGSSRGGSDDDEESGSSEGEGHVHERGLDLLSNDQDEDIRIEMQERNGGGGLHSKLGLNGDDEEVASDGSRNREDEPVASADAFLGEFVEVAKAANA
ncbi:Hypothetical predicted protein [Olea europaea subsp. europaea]|uniref:DUF1985 domain-containing protein n=1 Tax=Olea europaea subsp. europaea TaxID=158383 RepID=A0A8S0PTK0_OLEEU|nr:Hypothetical predicted protein [Olea europaea subsp. europaea]